MPPDVWLPGAFRDPGDNAGYNSGYNQMKRTVAHFTVGNDSRNTGRRGYFHFLVHKDVARENGCTQYAEINAVTWHAANQGNPYGPGVEFERMTTGGYGPEGLANADPLTPNQIDWGRRIASYLAEWGVPRALWNGPRFGPAVMPGGNYSGWVNHHDIDSERADGFTSAEWELLVGGAPSPVPLNAQRGEEMVIEETLDAGGSKYWHPMNGKLAQLDPALALQLIMGTGKFMQDPPNGVAHVKMGTLSLFAYVARTKLEVVKL